MENKLRSNKDWFIGEDLQDIQERIAAYITTCTENPARDQLETLIKALHNDGQPIDSEFLMNTIEQSFGDPYKEENARQAFTRLRLRTAADFPSFQAEFFRLVTQRKLSADQWVEEFYDRLTDPLYVNLSYDVARLKDNYNEFVTKARALARATATADERATARAERHAKKTATLPRPRAPVPAQATIPSPVLPLPQRPRAPATTPTQAEQLTCYYCHKPGYTIRACPSKPAEQKAVEQSDVAELPADVEEETFYEAPEGSSDSELGKASL